MSDICEFGKCRQPASLIYYDKDVCWKHWTQICEKGKEWAFKKLKIKVKVIKFLGLSKERRL